MTEIQYYVSGEWSKEGNPYVVNNPFDGTEIYKVFEPTAERVEQAIQKLEAAFEETRNLPTWKRAEILNNIAQGIKDRKDELAAVICEEAGKPMQFANGEVDRAIMTFTLAAQYVMQSKGEILPLDISENRTGLSGFVRRFPIGTVLAITPFNFPLNLVAHKVAPCIAAGNPILLKPATKTPVTAIKLTEIIEQSGWPKAALATLPCFPELTGRMVADDRIKKLSFTGSPKVGWMLKSNAGKKKVTLELGGDAAAVVDETADLKDAAKKVAFGAFAYAGQVCISVQRILVHENVYDEFRELLIAETKAAVAGDPAKMETLAGPMIDAENVARIKEWIAEAEEGGAKKIAEGNSEFDTVVAPVVLENIPAGSRLASQEAFAPVAILESFSTFEQAIEKVNDTPFGLQVGVFTDSQSNIKHAFADMHVGGVIVNNVPTLRVDNMPYGGIKDSGFGREGIEYAISEMTELKVMVW